MSNLNKYKALIFIRYLGESLLFPFISLFLKGIGFTTAQIGIVIAAIPLTSLVCAPIYSMICKTPRAAKHMLTLMTFLEPLFVVILIYSKSFALSLACVIMIGIFTSSNYGMFDSVLSLSCKKENKTFASVRLYGSVSYCLGVLVSSPIIQYLGYKVLFFIAVGMFITTGILYLFTKAPESDNENNASKVSFKEIFSNKLFIGYLIFYVLFLGTCQVSDDFLSLYLQSKGNPDHYYSYVIVGFVLIEIITMATFKLWYKKVGLSSYFIAIGCLLAKNLVHMIPQSTVGMIIAMQMLRGILWGIAMCMNTLMIIEILGFEKATRGIVLVTFGVSSYGAIFKLCGGYIIDAVGFPVFYSIMFGLSVVCLIYFIFYFIIYKKKTSTEM